MHQPVHHPRTKVVCTLGPASANRAQISALLQAGMNVARINFSHGTHEAHAETIRIVREVALEARQPVAILGDLQGPRIRIGDLAEKRVLAVGDDVTLVVEGLERGMKVLAK